MPDIPLPRRGLRWLVEQTLGYDLLIALLGTGSLLNNAFRAAGEGKPFLTWFNGVAATLVWILVVAKVRVQYAALRGSQSLHDLAGCLHTVHGILMGSVPPGAAPYDLRITVHVPAAEGARLVQVVDYVTGSGAEPGGAGRAFVANAGIIGRALQSKEAVVSERRNDNYESYVAELVHDWNYTEAAARALDPTRMAWMAVPILDATNAVLGILYFDVIERGFFTDDRKRTAIFASSGIARYVVARYR